MTRFCAFKGPWVYAVSIVMRKVPFYPNQPGDAHGAIALYQILFDYFLDRRISIHDLEKMSGFTPGKNAWTVTIWERMANQGFDIRMIEPLDYHALAKDGASYLRTVLDPESYEWQVKHSNITEITSSIPSFIERVNPENRRASLQDITDMLHEDRLVFVTLNSNALYDIPGYAMHVVLIIGQEGDDLILHDAGLPPRPYHRVSAQKLWTAMGGEHHTSEVTGIKFKATKMRSDVILAHMHPTYSRAALAKLFDKGLVKYEGRTLKPGDKLLSNVKLEADLSSLQQTSQKLDLPILYEDEDVLVINKPAGVLTHVQGPFNPEATVASFVRERTAELSGERAGIVHRLDRPTSGVMIAAKHGRALSFLQKQFANRTVKKTYVAIVQGHLPEKEAVIDMPIERNPKTPSRFRVGINGKPAKTRYKVLHESDDASLIELYPETGRTHQLRVHLAELKHPIIGDPLYGSGKHNDRLYLHAHSLEIVLPHETEAKMFSAPIPDEFKHYVGT